MAAPIRAEHRFTVEDYLKLLKSYPEEYDKTELIDGVIYDTMSESDRHAEYCESIASHYRKFYSSRLVRTNGSVQIGGNGLLEPDVWIKSHVMDGVQYWPGECVTLVVEVSLSTEYKDTTKKLRAYSVGLIPSVIIVTENKATRFQDSNGKGQYLRKDQIPFTSIFDWSVS